MWACAISRFHWLVLLLLIWSISIHSLSTNDLTCYSCNSTHNQFCFGQNPNTTKNCTYSRFTTNGCYTLLINKTEAIKGCISTRTEGDHGPTISHCISFYARFELVLGKCLKRQVSLEAYNRLLSCQKYGLQPNQGPEDDKGPGEIEVAICACQGPNLCNAQGNNMDPGGNEVQLAEKMPEPRNEMDDGHKGRRNTANGKMESGKMGGILLIVMIAMKLYVFSET